MEKWELIAPCHFGLEAVLKREILDLGYEISKVEDGKVTFFADAQGGSFLDGIRTLMPDKSELTDIPGDGFKKMRQL